jgi:hypothetical protein
LCCASHDFARTPRHTLELFVRHRTKARRERTRFSLAVECATMVAAAEANQLEPLFTVNSMLLLSCLHYCLLFRYANHDDNDTFASTNDDAVA